MAEDKRTKKQLLAHIEYLTARLGNSEAGAKNTAALLLQREEQIAYNQKQLMSVTDTLNRTGDQLVGSEFKATLLSDDLQLAQDYLVAAWSREMTLADRVHKEVDGRAREQVLLKALMAIPAKFHEVVDTVRHGAELAQVDEEVALDVADKYLRAEIVAKADQETITYMQSKAEETLSALADIFDDPPDDLSDAGYARAFSD